VSAKKHTASYLHYFAYVFIYIYIYTYIYTHTHTHTNKNNALNLLCVFYALTDDDVTFTVLLHVDTY
jgi:hypothetical protein